MQVFEDFSLKEFNTFHIDAKARFFASINSIEDLREGLTSDVHTSKFVLGGGSNMLLLHDIDALVLHINLKGIEKAKEDENHVWVRVAAGENWHEFVLFCVNSGYGGVENLSLIPGNVGTSPIQNIGAYGVELKDVFDSCIVVDKLSLKSKQLNLTDCRFDYRDSIFKNEAKGKYIITEVVFKLTKKNHELNTSYGAINTVLLEKGITNPSLKDVSNAVIKIRQEKLPDPNVIGNSGSFFKNPVVSKQEFDMLQARFEDIPFYPISENEIKIPAGWLIEQAGFKGKRFGDAGVHDRQALVLVNHGNATGEEIWLLAKKIQQEISRIFQVTIEPEVNLI
ncbi:MAG: UDP-N-acetylenolpyruvoylglucosamine reductase [Cytophagaceae bacterium]|nr:UDP-N-acetylenolpyruvoylglucosamine reductase [Cytophagaceae bacterium]|tara:strand:- start:3319 stop:4332 length:1014 start_codon:yes stop_codon:yes gene_type:complete